VIHDGPHLWLSVPLEHRGRGVLYVGRTARGGGGQGLTDCYVVVCGEWHCYIEVSSWFPNTTVLFIKILIISVVIHIAMCHFVNSLLKRLIGKCTSSFKTLSIAFDFPNPQNSEPKNNTESTKVSNI